MRMEEEETIRSFDVWNARNGSRSRCSGNRFRESVGG